MNAPAPYEPRVPSDSMPPGRAALSVTWAALPFLTLGYATPFTFAAAALWRRSAHLLVSAGVYLAVFAVMLYLLPGIGGDEGTERAVGVLLFVLAVVGCAHAFLIRRRVFDPHGLSAVDNEAVVERVKRQRLLREKARELAAADPGLAKELRIGRPDLPRQYNDGGLVDVDHAGRGADPAARHHPGAGAQDRAGAGRGRRVRVRRGAVRGRGAASGDHRRRRRLRGLHPLIPGTKRA